MYGPEVFSGRSTVGSEAGQVQALTPVMKLMAAAVAGTRAVAVVRTLLVTVAVAETTFLDPVSCQSRTSRMAD